MAFLVSMMRSFLSFSQKMLLIALAPGDSLRKQHATAIFLKMRHDNLEREGLSHILLHKTIDTKLFGSGGGGKN